mmetsp:Transcript_12400/g.37841  ORF Transcript_12400/g.37841 Transcript_12400/m.37841 type:complete len:376 (+) Transcript_12400:111-1238(+)
MTLPGIKSPVGICILTVCLVLTGLLLEMHLDSAIHARNPISLCNGPSESRSEAEDAGGKGDGASAAPVSDSLASQHDNDSTNDSDEEFTKDSSTTSEAQLPGPVCNESVEVFFGKLSPECRKLWRADLFDKSIPKRISYLHMPKAGTSFTTALRNFMPACKLKDRACPHGEVSDDVLRCDNKLIACNGHRPFDKKFLQHQIAASKSQDRYAYVSMIRDPGKRLASAKAHDCHRYAGPVPTPLAKECAEYSVEEFADLHFIQNCQTKMLSGYSCAGNVQADALNTETAKANLWRLDFFGITDFWNLSVRLFHCQFGGDLRESELLNSRPGAYNESVSQQTLDYVRNVEKLDMEIYRYAVDLFMKRVDCLKCSEKCV